MAFVVDGSVVDELRRGLDRGDVIPTDVITSFSLGAAFELSCAARHEAGVGRTLRQLLQAHPLLATASKGLAGEGADVADVFGAPDHEVRPAPRDGHEMSGLGWTEHRDRFGRALRQTACIDGSIARAITAAYAEMVDNVISHSAPPGEPTPPSVVGFLVAETHFEFAVADLGRGVRASLHDKEAHRELRSHEAALRAAVQQGATRRAYAAGNGFKDLHLALADLRGLLRFRTGDVALTLDGRGADRHAVVSASPDMVGFQLAVSCDLEGRG